MAPDRLVVVDRRPVYLDLPVYPQADPAPLLSAVQEKEVQGFFLHGQQDREQYHLQDHLHLPALRVPLGQVREDSAGQMAGFSDSI